MIGVVDKQFYMFVIMKHATTSIYALMSIERVSECARGCVRECAFEVRVSVRVIVRA